MGEVCLKHTLQRKLRVRFPQRDGRDVQGLRELAASPIALELALPAVPARGGEPLGYDEPFVSWYAEREGGPIERHASPGARGAGQAATGPAPLQPYFFFLTLIFSRGDCAPSQAAVCATRAR